MPKNKKPVTRLGTVRSTDIIFGSEERFKEADKRKSSDVSYTIPDPRITPSVVFSSSLRKPMADTPQSSTGPGSYNIAKCYDNISDFHKHDSARFGISQRQSMALNTPSPGAIYNIEKTYFNGPDKGVRVGFNCDSRDPSSGSASTGNNADPVYPKLPTGTAITIAQRFKEKKNLFSSPSYDPYVRT